MDKICAICGEPITDNQQYHQDTANNYYHDDCVADSDDFFICPDCNTVYPTDDEVAINDGDYFVCQTCAESYYIQCDDCGRYFSTDNIINVEDDRYCQDCLDSQIDCGNIDTCGCCGDYFYTENMHWNDYDGCYYCYNCRDDDDDLIRSYHDNPSLVMFPDTNEPHFGIELEVDGGDSPDDLATALRDILTNHAYFMHDGSLDNGVEIITQPHTLDGFYKLPWDEDLDTCKDRNFK